ncbi:hypothetical protein Glove_350g23 [Diversispora epigaea]|uniref:TLDc domain-containing protein n=1 Tax=Diversispora epigaea TaxID=1348612 RepID=A0A397HHF0_9GLOM|nr:hypothetical protein Glove_350g23 [Diversispora epigaea]
MAPDWPITSTILPPQKILTKTFPTRNTLFSLSSQIITDEHALETSSWEADVKTIYEICDKVSNTVIILKVEGTGEILGGYNPTDKNCYCIDISSDASYEKLFRSAEFLGSVHDSPDKSTFNVEEYEIYKVSKVSERND